MKKQDRYLLHRLIRSIFDLFDTLDNLRVVVSSKIEGLFVMSWVFDEDEWLFYWTKESKRLRSIWKQLGWPIFWFVSYIKGEIRFSRDYRICLRQKDSGKGSQ